MVRNQVDDGEVVVLEEMVGTPEPGPHQPRVGLDYQPDRVVVEPAAVAHHVVLATVGLAEAGDDPDQRHDQRERDYDRAEDDEGLRELDTTWGPLADISASSVATADRDRPAGYRLDRAGRRIDPARRSGARRSGATVSTCAGVASSRRIQVEFWIGGHLA